VPTSLTPGGIETPTAAKQLPLHTHLHGGARVTESDGEVSAEPVNSHTAPSSDTSSCDVIGKHILPQSPPVGSASMHHKDLNRFRHIQLVRPNAGITAVQCLSCEKLAGGVELFDGQSPTDTQHNNLCCSIGGDTYTEGQ